MDFTRPGQMKIRITGTEKRKGAWKVYGDLNGRIKMETGADGRYEFEAVSYTHLDVYKRQPLLQAFNRRYKI